MDAEYVVDGDCVANIQISKDHLLIDGTTSVSAWEAPIQKLLAATTVEENDIVLEVGYGLGMASRAIAIRRPSEHWLIERHPTILFNNAQSTVPEFTGTLLASWQMVLPLLRDGSFDAILFDADPVASSYDGSVARTVEFIAPFMSAACRLLTPGGRLGFIDFSAALSLYAPFERAVRDLDLAISAVSVPTCAPPNCAYAPHATTQIVRLTKHG